MFKRGSITVLRVKQVPIRLHFSVLLLVPVLTWALAVQARQIAAAAGIQPGLLGMPGWAWGVLASVGLLISITVHELAHTVFAIRYGGRVESIVLMALGGVSQISKMPKEPKHELVMAAAGPLTSLALGVIFGFGYRLSLGAAPNLAFYLFLLGYLNLVLGVFNLLPAFPMDGGRVLRAALSGRLGARKATNVAAVVGKAMAVAFGIFGLFGGGIWMILIAFFVWSGASQEKLFSDLKHALGHTRVGEVQNLAPTVQSTNTLEEARIVIRDAGGESAIVEKGQETIGVIRKLEILAKSPQERMKELVRDHMLRIQPLAGSQELRESFDKVLRGGELPVVDDEGQPTGVIRSRDVLSTLRDHGFRFPGERRGQANGDGSDQP